MADTNPRDLIKFLIDALKEECNWIDNPKHDELIAKANAYLTQYEPEVATDEELNSQSTSNDCQIRSSDIDPLPELIEQWMQSHATKYDLARHAAQWGADQELEACRMEIIDGAGRVYIDETSDRVRLADDLWSARRPPQPSLKEQALAELEKVDMLWDTTEFSRETLNSLDTIRRALEQLPNAVVTLTHLS